MMQWTIKSNTGRWLLSVVQRLLRRFYFSVTVTLPKSAAYHMYLYRIAHMKFEGLNLGSGGSKIKRFCNIDASPIVNYCDVIARIDKIKLSSDSVGTIYSSHVFEHIPRARAATVLAEWYRVLKPGGRLYISVPDLEVGFNVYLHNLPSFRTEEGRALVEYACQILYGAQRNRHDFHFSGYSFVTLKDLLQSVGFKGVRTFDRGNLDIAPFRDSSLVKIGDVPISLNVEASK